LYEQIVGALLDNRKSFPHCYPVFSVLMHVASPDTPQDCKELVLRRFSKKLQTMHLLASPHLSVKPYIFQRHATPERSRTAQMLFIKFDNGEFYYSLLTHSNLG
jgi:hypothetical protein